MGVKQSKRSVDITETSTKGEIEGFGNEGKVEKIIDGVVEKVAANGHVDGELQNGIEPVQNGVEVLQNGEAATVATEKITEITEKKDADESSVEGIVNGQVEANGEVNGEAEKSEEGKKTEEKKERKKEKKEKAVKKKFSLRNFSFSRKDKSKPLKEEKSAGKVDEAETEESVTSPENETASPSQEQLSLSEKPEDVTKPVTDDSISNRTITISKPEMEVSAMEKTVELSSTIQEDLPPPLPASPPPSEPVEGKLSAEVEKLDISEPASEKPSSEICEVTSSISNVITEHVETTQEVIKNADQMAMETGKQIEEKATNLLKTVEERAEESMRAIGESLSQKVMEGVEGAEGALGAEEVKVETKEEKQEVVVDEASKLEETVTGIPVEISNVGTLSPKGEEPTEKHEEGAGESLADIPKDLTDEVTATAIEVSTPDSLEISATIPPPPQVVEPVTGE